MNKKRILLITVSICVLLILFIITPIVLFKTAESKLDNIKDFNKAPGVNYYSAMKSLGIAKISPFFKKQCNDLMLHFTLKYMGHYKIKCQEIISEAKKKARENLRSQRDKELNKFRGNLKKLELIRKKYDLKEDNLQWKKWVKPEVRTNFCKSWKKYILLLKKRKVKISCSFCDAK